MAEAERANVVSKSFSEGVGTMIKTLMESSSFSDVTIVCDDHVKIRAHKLVLSSSSSLFKEFLKDDVAISEIVLIGIKGSDIESIMKFIYLGEVDILQDNLCSFISTAKNLKFDEIVKTVKKAREQIVNTLKTNPNSKIKTEKVTEVYIKEEEDLSTDYVNERDLIQPKKGEKFDCDKCGAELLNLKTLQAHKRFQHRGKFYPCDQCDYKPKQLNSLKLHKNAIHEGIRYQCKECDYKASSKQLLTIHTTGRHGVGIKQYCTLCNFSTATKYRLRMHIESVHEKLYKQCTYCDYKSKYNWTLYEHIKSVHEGVTYPCDQCKHVTKSKCDLKRHVKRRHSKIQNKYPCDQCDHQFKEQGSLKRHIKNKHEGVKYA